MKVLYLETTLKLLEVNNALTLDEIATLAQNGNFIQSQRNENIKYLLMEYDENDQVVNLNIQNNEKVEV